MPPADNSKILDAMLDETTSTLISALESGPKTVAELSQSSGIGVDDIHKRFAPLVNAGLIVRTDTQNETTYSADAEKLDAALKSHNFDESINVITQMDSYLN